MSEQPASDWEGGATSLGDQDQPLDDRTKVEVTQEQTQFLVFRVADVDLALPLTEVDEILRPPTVTPVPLSPPAVLGITSLRGRLLPVACLRRLAGLGEAEDSDESARVLVVNAGSPVGLRVDAVRRVVAASTPAEESGEEAEPGEDSDQAGLITRGSIRLDDGVIQRLDTAAILERELGSWQPEQPAEAGDNAPGPATAESTERRENREQLHLVITVGGQRFAFAAEPIREVVDHPEEVSPVPRAPDHVLGVSTLREELVPLVSLQALLGLPTGESCRRVVILPVGPQRIPVGFPVEEVNDVLGVPPEEVEPMPRLSGDAADEEFAGVWRSGKQERLITLLDSEKLVARHGLVDTARGVAGDETNTGANRMNNGSARQGQGELHQFVVFQLQGQDFAARIEAVREILRLPEDLTGVPASDAEVEGVINLRGRVLPVVNLRRRLGMEQVDRDEFHRVLVLEIQGEKTGFVVDSVSEVLKVPADRIESGASLSASRADWVDSVLRRDEQDDSAGMVLVVDEERLLSEQSREELASVR